MTQYAGLDYNSDNGDVGDDDTDTESHSADEGHILAAENNKI